MNPVFAPIEPVAPSRVRPRSFLFLQGPISGFFDRLGRTLMARGHRVHRINLHFGDQLFWHLPATHYRGRFEDWRGFIAEMLKRHAVTDLVLTGDCRPYHLVAAEEARARGVSVVVTDLGYLRPDWITLERDGMSTYSRFPRDPGAIRALAEKMPEPDLAARYHNPFPLVAALDVVYNFGMVLGRVLYPHYRNHGLYHPFAEYAGWLGSRALRRLRSSDDAAAKQRLAAEPRSYFLFPLQLATDFQIRAHSPFADARDALRQVVRSFAAADTDRKLVIVVHPLDNGLIRWTKLVRDLASEFGAGQRVLAFNGGIPSELLCNAAGVVTINSTVGTTALYHGIPVKVLGNAVFDISGLTSQQTLSEFWHTPKEPDSEFVPVFMRALVGATQVKGGYYTRPSQAKALAGFVERLEGALPELPPFCPDDLADRPVRPVDRQVVVAGSSHALGRAIARAIAGPGVRLRLLRGPGIAEASAAEALAADCRRRGAVVDSRECRGGKVCAGLSSTAPLDMIVVEPAAGLGGAAAVALGRALPRGDAVRLILVGATPQQQAAARERLRGRGVAVTVAAPGRAAAWLARHVAAELGEVSPDRAAQAIRRGLGKGHARIAIPPSLPAVARALRLAPAMLREWARATIAGTPEPAINRREAPLPRQSGTGD